MGIMIDTPRTIIPRHVGLGTARLGDRTCALLRIEDGDDVLDIVLDKALLGELIAHGQDIRTRA